MNKEQTARLPNKSTDIIKPLFFFNVIFFPKNSIKNKRKIASNTILLNERIVNKSAKTAFNLFFINMKYKAIVPKEKQKVDSVETVELINASSPPQPLTRDSVNPWYSEIKKAIIYVKSSMSGADLTTLSDNKAMIATDNKGAMTKKDSWNILKLRVPLVTAATKERTNKNE